MRTKDGTAGYFFHTKLCFRSSIWRKKSLSDYTQLVLLLNNTATLLKIYIILLIWSHKYTWCFCLTCIRKHKEFMSWYGTAAAAAANSLQSCLTLCDPKDVSPPGSPSLGFSRQGHWSVVPLLSLYMELNTDYSLEIFEPITKFGQVLIFIKLNYSANLNFELPWWLSVNAGDRSSTPVQIPHAMELWALGLRAETTKSELVGQGSLNYWSVEL